MDLGAATSFAVLAGTTVTSAGVSTVTGDLGVSPGTAVTGFPPGVVTGTRHDGDLVAAQAQAALTAAYNDVAGRAPTATVTADLGGQTLGPGVYQASALSLSLTGTLTLDAQGNPDAEFIFQAGSTLTTAANSAVLLVNGADACNVFWQVGSSATLGAGTDFAGSILVFTTVTAGAGITVDGRILARNGAVTLDNDTVTRPICDTSGTASFTTPLSAGSHTITATFTGDDLSTSTGSLLYTTTKANSTTTLTSSPNPSTVGQPVTLTATVAAVPPGSGIPSGTVTFIVDGVAGSPVSLAGGQASTTVTPAGGPHTIVATYNGDNCFNISTSAALTQTVNPGPVNPTLTATPAVIRLRVTGAYVIPVLSATLKNATTGLPIPGQTITFTANPVTGAVTFGTATTDINGTATLTNVIVSATLVTTNHYTATYGGGPNPPTVNAPLTFQPQPFLP